MSVAARSPNRNPRWTVRPLNAGTARRDVGQARQPGFARELLGLLEASLGPRAEHPVLDPEQGDVVEHQRRDDLVDAQPGPQDTRDESPDPAGDGPGDHHHRDHHDRRCSGREDRRQHDRARAPRAKQELPLRADVPEAHPEGKRACEAGEDERGRRDQRVRQDADIAEGGIDDVQVCPHRIAADEGKDHRADEQGDDDRPDRRDRRQPARGRHPRFEADRHGASPPAAAASAAASSPPVMSSPIRSMSAESTWKDPTTRPS